MPLSDHEQRLLDEIEQALYAEDPKFVSSVRSARSRSGRRRALIASGVGALVGLGLVLVGLIAPIIPLSVIGFVLLVGAITFAVQSFRTRHEVPAAPQAGRGGGRVVPMQQRGFRSRMEQRLRKRFDQR